MIIAAVGLRWREGGGGVRSRWPKGVRVETGAVLLQQVTEVGWADDG